MKTVNIFVFQALFLVLPLKLLSTHAQDLLLPETEAPAVVSGVYTLQAFLGSSVFIPCMNTPVTTAFPYIMVNGIIYTIDRFPLGMAYSKNPVGLWINPVTAEHNGMHIKVAYVTTWHIEPIATINATVPLTPRSDLHCTNSPLPAADSLPDELVERLTSHPGQLIPLQTMELPPLYSVFNHGIYINADTTLDILQQQLDDALRPAKALVLLESSAPVPVTERVIAEGVSLTLISVTTEDPQDFTTGLSSEAAASGVEFRTGSGDSYSARTLSARQNPATIEARGPGFSGNAVIECADNSRCNLFGLRLIMADSTRSAPPSALMTASNSKGYVYNSEFIPRFGAAAATGDAQSIIYSDSLFHGNVTNVCALNCAKVVCHNRPACFAGYADCSHVTSGRHYLFCNEYALLSTSSSDETNEFADFTDIKVLQSAASSGKRLDQILWLGSPTVFLLILNAR